VYNLHLNLEKCVFGVGRGNFWEFMLTHQGIKANLEQCQVVIEMRRPKNVKEVQMLTG